MPEQIYEYLRDPKAIYERSFALIDGACDFSRLPADLVPLAKRLVHSCGLPEVLSDLAWQGEVAAAARRALASRRPLFVDSRMTEAGIIARHLPKGCAVRCFIGAPEVPDLAESLGTTRSAAAVELWLPNLEGAIVAIGNAPTALFHLLERLREGAARPAAILAFPVGFVGAAESKEALIESDLGVPFVTLRGRFGGSALAAAAVNGILAGLEG